MFYILYIILLFIISVMAHVLFCRNTNQPGLHAKAFILIIFIFLGFYIVSIVVLKNSGFLEPHTFWGLPFRVTAGTIYLLLAPIYLSFYVLTQLTSPSQKILLTIARQGEMSFADILAVIEKEDLIMTRLKELCASGCVVEKQGYFRLSVEGQSIALVLKLMQNTLGRKAGG